MLPEERARFLRTAAAVALMVLIWTVSAHDRTVGAQTTDAGRVFLPLGLRDSSVPAGQTGQPTSRPSPTAAMATPTPTGIVWPTDTPTSLPSVTPTATAPPTPTSGLPPWQQYVNYHRRLARLPGVTENPDWSHGGFLHARYMVKNNYIGHSESPGKPYYSKEGHEAAVNGNVFLSAATVGATQWYRTYRDAIDAWMTGPFHMLGIIDPRLRVSGFGEYEEDIQNWHRYGATLDVLRGREEVPPGVSYPVYYPVDGGIIPNLSYDGGENPDPLLAPKCRGYRVPTGPPVALQLGTGEVTPKVRRTAFRSEAGDLPHCWFDETTYAYSPGKEGLNMRDAIILMPKEPLEAGQRYFVTIETNDVVCSWSFTAQPQDRPLSSPRRLAERLPAAVVPRD